MENKQGKKLSKRQALRDQRTRQAKNQRILIISGVAIFAVAVIALIVFTNPGITGNAGEFVRVTPIAFQNVDGTRMGDPNAKVVIELFEDFKCGACANFNEFIEPLVIEQLVNTGKVYFIFRNLPFLDDRSNVKDSDNAANAVMCASEQGEFWNYKKILFTNLNGSPGEFNSTRLVAFAESLGLDKNQFQQCLRENRYQSQIDQDIALANDLNVTGTPSLFVNGVQIRPGFVPSFEDINQAVEAALAQ
jgi:protein-disulfide isomerase